MDHLGLSSYSKSPKRLDTTPKRKVCEDELPSEVVDALVDWNSSLESYERCGCGKHHYGDSYLECYDENGEPTGDMLSHSEVPESWVWTGEDDVCVVHFDGCDYVVGCECNWPAKHWQWLAQNKEWILVAFHETATNQVETGMAMWAKTRQSHVVHDGDLSNKVVTTAEAVTIAHEFMDAARDELLKEFKVSSESITSTYRNLESALKRDVKGSVDKLENNITHAIDKRLRAVADVLKAESAAALQKATKKATEAAVEAAKHYAQQEVQVQLNQRRKLILGD